MEPASEKPSTSAAPDANWRRERNIFAVVAVVIVALTLAIALPRRVQDYRRLKALNEELINLQHSIGEVQREIVRVQGEILEGQRRISEGG